MKRIIRLAESDLHNIVKESVARIMEAEDWKSPLDKVKGNKPKIKGKMDVSGYRKKNLHGKIRKDTIGDNIDDETMKKLKKLHSENYIRKAVRESVNRMLNENTIDLLGELEDKLIDVASEIKQIFFRNERYFDNVERFEKMGLDNPPYSYGSQGELSRSFDAEEWQKLTGGHGVPFEQELQETFKWYNTLKYKTECEGYGIGAASRGFNVTSPIGLLWTKSVEAIKILRKMAEITNTELDENDLY